MEQKIEPHLLERATSAYLVARHRNQPFEHPGIGFDFSSQAFNTYIVGLTPLRKEQLLPKAWLKPLKPRKRSRKPVGNQSIFELRARYWPSPPESTPASTIYSALSGILYQTTPQNTD